MTVLERLRQAIELLPDEAAVSLPVTLLRAALAEVPGPATASAAPELLTVARLAALLHRSPSTVRGWLARGDFGSAAVRVHGRSWIVPRDAVTDFLKRQHRGDPA